MIAQRAALRVFPLLFIGKNWLTNPKIRGNLSSRPILRSLLTSGAARADLHLDFTSVANAASASSSAAFAHSAYRPVFPIADSAASATYTITNAFHSGDTVDFAARAFGNYSSHNFPINSQAAVEASIGAFENVLRLVEADVQVLTSNQNLRTRPLWLEGSPDWFIEQDEFAVAAIEREFGAESFWLRWWEGAKSGDWMNWDLQRDIALIDDAVWQGDPKAVMVEIAKIEERYNLLAEVKALRIQLQEIEAAAVLKATAAQRSHNHPPELVDAETVAECGPIVTELQVMEVELAKPDPSATLIKRAANAILRSAKAIAAYCAKLADKGLIKVVETVAIAVSAKLVLFDWAAIVAKIETVGNWLLSFADKLPLL